MIKDYFNYKLNYLLIDKVVGAYKIGNKHIERYRTSHDKKYQDILNAARIPKSAKIAFVDDQKHYNMLHKNVFYIIIHGYTYFLSPEQVVHRLENSIFKNELTQNDLQYIYNTLKSINKRFVESENYSKEVFKTNGKNILRNIQTFVTKF